jgi:hypothetical protein
MAHWFGPAARLRDTHGARAQNTLGTAMVQPVATIGVFPTPMAFCGRRRGPRLASVDRIIHAGDFDDRRTMQWLCTMAELTAVRGNCDRGSWASTLPDHALITVEGISIYVVHDHRAPHVRPQGARHRGRDFRAHPPAAQGVAGRRSVPQSRQRRPAPLWPAHLAGQVARGPRRGFGRDHHSRQRGRLALIASRSTRGIDGRLRRPCPRQVRRLRCGPRGCLRSRKSWLASSRKRSIRCSARNSRTCSWPNLVLSRTGHVLQVGCGLGTTNTEILQQTDPDSRLIAVETTPAPHRTGARQRGGRVPRPQGLLPRAQS